MIFNWDDEKNEHLKKERRVSFEEIILAIENDRVLDVIIHPNSLKYGDQKLYIVALEEYVYVVPFREEKEEIFLITIFPSRKYTKLYFGKEKTSL